MSKLIFFQIVGDSWVVVGLRCYDWEDEVVTLIFVCLALVGKFNPQALLFLCPSSISSSDGSLRVRAENGWNSNCRTISSFYVSSPCGSLRVQGVLVVYIDGELMVSLMLLLWLLSCWLECCETVITGVLKFW